MPERSAKTVVDRLLEAEDSEEPVKDALLRQNLRLEPRLKDVTFTLVPEEELGAPDWEAPLRNDYPLTQQGEEDYTHDTINHREMLVDIERRLARGDLWAFCTAVVTACYTDPAGNEYCGRDSTGHCSYASAEDFMKNGYYEDMKCEAYSRLLRNFRMHNKLKT